MLSISHIYTANRLMAKLKVKKKETYYLATILPDIRYTTTLDRKRTHVPSNTLQKYLGKESDLYKGYFLHLWIDENMGDWGFYDKLRARFPFLLRKLLAKSFLNVIIELYCLEQLKQYSPIYLDDTFHKEFLKFGIRKKDFVAYQQKMQSILLNPTIHHVESVLLSDPKLKDNKKLKKYVRFGKLILGIPSIRNFLTTKVDGVHAEFVKEIKHHV